MSFWKFCEKVSISLASTPTVLDNIKFVHIYWLANMSVGETVAGLKEHCTRTAQNV